MNDLNNAHFKVHTLTVRIGATPTHMEDVGDSSCAAPRGSNYSDVF